jgi:hypothetical protein
MVTCLQIPTTLNRWNNFSQLLNIHRTIDVRQIEIHTAEDEIAIAKLERFKSPGSDQIPAELIQAGGEILSSKIHKLINSIWNMEKLPDQWKESIIASVHKKGDKADCSNYQGDITVVNFIQNSIEYSSLKAKSTYRLTHCGPHGRFVTFPLKHRNRTSDI